MIILSGYVKVTVDAPEGRATLLAVRVAGDLLGELGCLEERTRMATVTAAGAVGARIISGDRFRTFLRRDADAAVVVTTVVATKLRWTTRRRVDLGSYPVRLRLARVLADLAERHGVVTPDGVYLRLSFTQPELAALIGASEPAVHRALTDLRRRGLVVTGYRSTLIRDLTALQALGKVTEDE